MKIRNQYILSLIIFGFLLLIIAFSVIVTNQQVAQLENQRRIAGEIRDGISDLIYLSNDYFLYKDNQQVLQWRTLFSRLSVEIASLNSTSPERQNLVDTMNGNMQRLNAVFNDVVAYLESVPSTESVRNQVQFQTLWSRMAIQSQTLTFDASQLSQALTSQGDQVKFTNTVLVLSSFCAFGAYLLLNYLLTWRRTLKSISKLQTGMNIVGSGNLDHSIEMERKNEIDGLSRIFNQMTTNLKTVTASKADLEKEIEERKKAEKEIAALAKFPLENPATVLRIDQKGNILFANPSAHNFLKEWQINVGESAPQHIRQIVVDSLASGKRIEFEENLGEEIFSFLVAPIVAEGYANLYGRGITKRKKAEEALKSLNEELEERVRKRTAEVSSERQRLYNVLETIPAYVALLDKDYHVAFANKVFCDLFGESRGRPCYDFLFERNLPCENCETYKVLKSNSPHRWEWTGPNGRDYDVYDFPFIESDGSTLVLEMGIDITNRKRAEKQLRDASIYSRSLIEASLDPLVTINNEGKITDVNKATEQVTGGAREELIGSDFSEYFTEPEEARKGYQKVFADGFVKDYPLTIRHKSGKLTEVLYNATVFKSDSEIKGVFAAARDVTERKKLEKQVQDAERLAAIGATAGMVGHDIRNPLQAIIGDVYLTKQDTADLPESEEKQSMQENLDAIEQNVEYINKIVADLQDYARPLNPAAEETSIEALVQDILRKRNIPRKIKISYKIEKASNKLITDHDLLKRVLDNLIINAVQAMPNGGKLFVSTSKNAQDTIITVEDTGVGVPDEIKPKLFTPMFTTKSKGQGFGLAVVKRITEALGGTITFESEVGKGTKFIIHLPTKK